MRYDFIVDFSRSKCTIAVICLITCYSIKIDCRVTMRFEVSLENTILSIEMRCCWLELPLIDYIDEKWNHSRSQRRRRQRGSSNSHTENSVDGCRFWVAFHLTSKINNFFLLAGFYLHLFTYANNGDEKRTKHKNRNVRRATRLGEQYLTTFSFHLQIICIPPNRAHTEHTTLYYV